MLRTIAIPLVLMTAALVALPSRAAEMANTCETNSASCCNSTCPQCGCGLVPVCHTYCTTKKVTEYKYACVCEDLCVPGPVPVCEKCENCEGACECGGKCTLHQVRKLAKIPVTKEVPVRKCTVEWVCPTCNCQSGSSENAAPAAQPAAPMPPSPPAPPQT